MKKGLTELVFILDRSGSMSGLESDTIGGFNGLIEKQKKEEGEAFVSVILFDDQTEVLYDRVNLQKVEPMNERQYYVRGCTALLDALGGAIHHIRNVHKYAREEDVPEKTLFIITTDGMENASRRYTYEKVRAMVEHEKEKYHWEFLFLGANIDAVSVAGRFGVKANRAVRYENDGFGTQLNYSVMSKAVSSARSARSAKEMEQAFDSDAMLASIREDYAELEASKRVENKKEILSYEEKAKLEKEIDQFALREKRIAELVFGLNGEEAHSYDEAAALLNLPGARVRQIAGRARRLLAK